MGGWRLFLLVRAIIRLRHMFATSAISIILQYVRSSNTAELGMRRLLSLLDLNMPAVSMRIFRVMLLPRCLELKEQSRYGVISIA